MRSVEMGWDYRTGRWQVWLVTRELVADNLTRTQGEKLRSDLYDGLLTHASTAPGKVELQGCSLGGSPEKGVAPALRGNAARDLANADKERRQMDDTTRVNPRAEASAE